MKNRVKPKSSGVNWVIIFLVLILIANLVFSIILFNLYLYQKDLTMDIQKQLKSPDVTSNNVNLLYLDFYRELSEKTDAAINRILTIVAIIAGAVTIFSILLAFKAPKDIDKRIDEINNDLKKVDEAAEEAKYQVKIAKTITQKKLRHIMSNPIERLTAIIKEYPNKADAYFYRGIIKVEKELFDSAIQDFEIARKNGFSIDEYYNWMGIAYSRKGDNKKGIYYFSKYIETTEQIDTALCNRGAAYHNNNDIENACKDLDEALKRNPDCLFAYVRLSSIYYELSEKEQDKQKKQEYMEQAISSLRSAYDIDRKDEYVIITQKKTGISFSE